MATLTFESDNGAKLFVHREKDVFILSHMKDKLQYMKKATDFEPTEWTRRLTQSGKKSGHTLGPKNCSNQILLDLIFCKNVKNGMPGYY